MRPFRGELCTRPPSSSFFFFLRARAKNIKNILQQNVKMVARKNGTLSRAFTRRRRRYSIRCSVELVSFTSIARLVDVFFSVVQNVHKFYAQTRTFFTSLRVTYDTRW